MKMKIAIMLLAIALIALAAAGARRSNGFEPASDVPRGALVYVQVEDLPQFVKLVGESDSYGKFAASGTYAEYSKSRLGIKLATRLKEFGDAAGLGLSAETLSGIADKRAALALYDIGRLEFTLVAPMSDAVFAATKLGTVRDRFTAEKLDDGNVIYRANVRADSGRITQQIIFCHVGGRLIVATNDKLINQTLVNIAGKRGRSALADEPSFSELAGGMKPRLAAVWVDQSALNDNYYFRQYWRYSGGSDLTAIRAGLFDFGTDENSVSERRVFLTDGAPGPKNLEPKSIAAASRFVPADVPFYSIRSADASGFESAIADTLFDHRPRKSADAPVIVDRPIYGDRYEMMIDEEDPPAAKPESKVVAASGITARIRSIISFSRPRMNEAPLFFETDRAIVATLENPSKFDAAAFEKYIGDRFARENSVGGANFRWKSDGDWREIDLPFLSAGARYRIDGPNLVLTNGFKLSEGSGVPAPQTGFESYSVVNLDQRGAAFDSVFADLKQRGAETSFFTTMAGGVLDAFSSAKRIIITKRTDGKKIEETVVFEKSPPAR